MSNTAAREKRPLPRRPCEEEEDTRTTDSSISSVLLSGTALGPTAKPQLSRTRPEKRHRIDREGEKASRSPAVYSVVTGLVSLPDSAAVGPDGSELAGWDAERLGDDDHKGFEASLVAPPANLHRFRNIEQPALISPDPSTVDLRSYPLERHVPTRAATPVVSPLPSDDVPGPASPSSAADAQQKFGSQEFSITPTSGSGKEEDEGASIRSLKVFSSLFCVVLLLVAVIASLTESPHYLGGKNGGFRDVLLPVNGHGSSDRSTVPQRDRVETVCVPGGGFSGFWYTLGRLRSIRDPFQKEYYCFSAGCLGVVATLLNHSMEDMYQQASRVQKLWRVGDIGRYDVVGLFVDSMLSSLDDEGQGAGAPLPDSQDNATLAALLNRLRIITSVPNDRGWWGLRPSIRTPTTRRELRKMLLQTTWIPLATGGGLWHEGHLDGAFTLPQHPLCHYDVGLSLDMDLYSNVVNVNLPWSKVEKFWNAGLAQGL